MFEGDSSKKKCRRCKEVKPTSDFHRLHRSADRLQYWCKACSSELSKRPEVSSRRNERLSTPEGKSKHAAHAKRHRLVNPEKAHARHRLNKAIAAGIVDRSDSCNRCGAVPETRSDGRSSIQGHHKDYSMPLCVEWLCPSCHEIADAEVINAS